MNLPRIRLEWGGSEVAKKAQAPVAPRPRPGILAQGVVRRVDLVCPDGVEILPDAVRVGPARWIRTYVVHALPGEVDTMWLTRLLDSYPDLDVSTEVYPLDAQAAQRDLTAAIARLQGEASTGTAARSGLGIDRLQKEYEDLVRLRALLAREEDGLFHVAVTIQVGAPTEAALREACNRLESDMAVMGVTVRQMFWRQADALGAAGPLPAGAAMRDARRNMTRGAMGATLPLGGTRWLDEEGMLVGWESMGGGPILFSPWSKRLQTAHMVIIGEPGGGKSVLCKVLCAREALRGAFVVVIDHVGEYASAFREHLGAEVVAFDPERPSGINLLEVRAEEDDADRMVVPLKRKAEEITAWVSLLRECSQDQLARVEQAVLACYAAAGITAEPDSLWLAPGEGAYAGRQLRRMPQLSDLLVQAETAGVDPGLVSVLRRYTVQGSRPMFDCQTAERSARILVLDVRRVSADPQLLAVTMDALLGWLWATLGGIQGPKMVLVDEAWQLLRHRQVAEFLAAVARGARKKHISLCMATQFIREFRENQYAQDVLASAPTRWIGRMAEEDAAAVAELLQLSAGQSRSIGGFATGQFLLKSGSKSAILQVTPTGDELVWYETDPRKIVERERLRADAAAAAG